MGTLVPHSWPAMDVSADVSWLWLHCALHMLVAFGNILVSVYSAFL